MSRMHIYHRAVRSNGRAALFKVCDVSYVGKVAYNLNRLVGSRTEHKHSRAVHLRHSWQTATNLAPRGCFLKG